MIDGGRMAKARQVGFRALRIAEASAAGIGAIGHGHPDSSPPAGVVITRRTVTHEPSTGEQVQDRLNAAIVTGSPFELDAAIAWCERELDTLQRGPGVEPETTQQFHWRLATQYENVPAAKVAVRERTSETTVRNARTKHGYTAARGIKVVGASDG